MRGWLIAVAVFGILALPLSGCARPKMPSMVGPGKFHDIEQVRLGMSANEVERIMGANHKLIYEEGLQGMDGGNYIWEYPEGRVYINMDGVTKVVPFSN